MIAIVNRINYVYILMEFFSYFRMGCTGKKEFGVTNWQKSLKYKKNAYSLKILHSGFWLGLTEAFFKTVSTLEACTQSQILSKRNASSL